ncbi:MAG: lipopolysaccharide biosynthesis protein RfbH [Candidatus Omnitrophica bacterium]|nr:lipopolysaccharide biosynthesis protein RfbH [Candidatus Omnitrophota bacterium]
MSDARQIRHLILQKTKEYYRLVHDKSRQLFEEGKSHISYAGRVFDENEMINLIDASLEFWLTGGHYTAQFERKLSQFLGVRFVLMVNSGSSANLLAFMTLTSPLLKERRIERGDEVITVAAGFPTTIAPIVQYGAVPVFVDVDLPTLNIDVSLLEKAMSPRTKAVALAHTLGNPFNIRAVKEFCQKHCLWLIEDNCDALGSQYQGQYTGTFGDMATSSFYPPHHITTGEGGAVYTQNAFLKTILLSLRDWGRSCWCESGKDNTCGKRFSHEFKKLPMGYDHKYVYSHFGYNLKATDLQAAIGCAQLEKLAFFIEKRKENFEMLYEGLKDLDCFTFPQPTAHSTPCWFGFLFILKDNAGFRRNDIVEFLEQRQIQTRSLFGGNMTKQPCFDHLEEGRDYRIIASLKNADKLMRDSFWVGVYPGLSQEAVWYIIKMVRSFVNNLKP